MSSASIAAALVGATQAQTQQQLQAKMLKMSMQPDQAVVAMLDQAASSGSGSAPLAAGTGGFVDVTV
ncbi:hypothetical protein ADZ37_16995 [Pannonibacter phragmitetus]|jgi:hypothetical protein|uniref:Motility protein n=1 Tax=Pannonibacter indicus TaxID=466044 RepID=A0A0K6HS59_9HYPH|nr:MULTISPECIES: hypothetical protein [Pannonibacter]KND17776.1 hypothetical protein ADZ37_16995 [Pannonibacter phragmitetus]MBA4206121.1 hypothetical protein [Polymorphum sp.]CUA93760.1 hypothetical protein Ga0061067_102504 [Pannonibacter indicus]